jgi:phenylacetate-CoA ligase
MNIKKYLNLLPEQLKQSLKYAYGLLPARIRFGKVFWETYNFLQESQWWSREKLEKYQLEQLEKLLNHAYKNVPYYRRVFDERGLKPGDIQSLNDLRKLPTLTKDEFRVNYKDLIAENLKSDNLFLLHTSGTTGKPLQWYVDEVENKKELAFIFHQWARVGVNPGEKLVQIRGSIIDNKRLCDYDPINRVLRLSPRIDSKDVVKYYIEKIHKFGAKFLHGYPSIIALFAYKVKEYQLELPFKLEAVLFASENVYSWQREICEDVFECRTYSHYGMAERVALAGECEKSTKYHFVPQYSIVEIDENTKEIVCTSFINYVTPFIRYKTTDVASMPFSYNCDECGRNYYPILDSIEGRLEDYIISRRGEIISPRNISYLFHNFKTIKNAQVIQKSLDLLEVKVVLKEKESLKRVYSEFDELHEIKNKFQSLVGSDVRIEIKIVDSIKTSKTGKYRFVISNVSKYLYVKS